MFLWEKRKEKTEDEIYKGAKENLKGDETERIKVRRERVTAKRMRKLKVRGKGLRCRIVCSSFFICKFPHSSFLPFHLPFLLCFWLCTSELNRTRKACLSSQILFEWWNNIKFMHNFSVLFKKLFLKGSFALYPFHLLMCVSNAFLPNYFVTILLSVQYLHWN